MHDISCAGGLSQNAIGINKGCADSDDPAAPPCGPGDDDDDDGDELCMVDDAGLIKPHRYSTATCCSNQVQAVRMCHNNRCIRQRGEGVRAH